MTPREFLDRLQDRPLIFDGAMGTVIYEHGVFVNACYDELCLSRAELILRIHREYINAGVDVIETNSFGANRVKLAGFGLAEDAVRINRAAAALAREAAGTAALVAGSVGPLLLPGQSTADLDGAAAEALFDEQIRTLAQGGVDLLLLETFEDLDALRCAASVARKTGLPVVASFSVRHRTSGSTDAPRPEIRFVDALNADPNVDVIGLNCGTGPAGMLELLRAAIPRAAKPVIAMPNAGGPAEIGGRLLYFNSPEYFTEYARRFIELGARGVGGCCGTRPEDLRTAVRAVAGMSGVRKHLEIQDSTPEQAETVPVSMEEKSAFASRLAAGERVTSIEILPPRKLDGLAGFVAAGRRCREAGVDAINIPDGPRASARLSVLVSALTLQREAGIEAIPHYCCRDRNLIGMQADLMGGAAAGLHNWLLITGDPPKLGDYPDASGVFDLDAIGLCRLVSNLNRGLDAAGKPVGPPAALLLGVGANPVAIELDREFDRFAAKIDAGAEFAITQPVFDPDALLRFLDRVARFPRRIPLLAGIYPLASAQNAIFMNQHVPGVSIPAAVIERMSACRTREDALKTGIEIARSQVARVIDAVQGIQVSAPFGKLDIALAVLES